MPHLQEHHRFASIVSPNRPLSSDDRAVWLARSWPERSRHPTPALVTRGRNLLKDRRAAGTSLGQQDTPDLRWYILRLLWLGGSARNSTAGRHVAVTALLSLLGELALNDGSSALASTVIGAIDEVMFSADSDRSVLREIYLGLRAVVYLLRPPALLLVEAAPSEVPPEPHEWETTIARLKTKARSMRDYPHDELANIFRGATPLGGVTHVPPARVLAFGVSGVLRSTLEKLARETGLLSEVLVLRGIHPELAAFRPEANGALPPSWRHIQSPLDSPPTKKSTDLRRWLIGLNVGSVLFGSPLLTPEGVLAEKGAATLIRAAQHPVKPTDCHIDTWCLAGPYKYLLAGRYRMSHARVVAACQRHFDLVPYRHLDAVFCG